ncbi:hypothetical protein [Rhizobium rhizogenes]|jgi:hypothetical protein|uniref:hypothetical protein n=1 Tax=Rhizobium rhizogenes TaxID=359 RepID=UPI00157264E8|nr:hypothetical protein [Rhizobium rhizogenes]NTI32974.1 hypothetical protein [Rhizobium rhizogenes]
MNTESKPDTYTLSAFFADENDAEDAATALMDAGMAEDAVTMTPGNRPDVPPIDHLGFLDALTGIFFHEEQRTAYAEALQRGGTLVTVQISNDAQHETALNILAEKGQIETDEQSRHG